jgi:dTDP-4-amino-4,6-dideoxygalactose transaminase
LNAVPLFVDVDPVTFNIDPKDVERKVTAKTKALIPVHLFGQSSAMTELMAVAKKHGLKVIEDGAQAIGVQYRDGRHVGTIGDIGCFSFFPSKNLGCFGDGGLVTTNDDVLAERLKIMRVHGGKPKYYHKVIGGNFRLDAIQAAVISVKLPHLDGWSAKRRENAALYTKSFVESGLAEKEGNTVFDEKNFVLLPEAVYKPNIQNSKSTIQNYHIYNQYCIRVERRDDLRKFLTEKGIRTEIYYPVPFHRQECFRYLNPVDADYPVSNASADHIVALPIFPELSGEQIRYVVDSIGEFFHSGK